MIFTFFKLDKALFKRVFDVSNKLMFTFVMAGLMILEIAAASSISVSNLSHFAVMNDRFDFKGIRQELASSNLFYQIQPHYGETPSEKTIAYFGFTKNSLRIWVLCEHQMTSIQSDTNKRDQRIDSGDSVLIVLDTFNDGKHAFVFGTNPNNALIDGIIENNEDINYSWDGQWNVSVTMNQYSWLAVFDIPFDTLQFSDQFKQTWGANISRFIHKKNETIVLSKYPIHKDLTDLKQLVRLTDIHTDVQQQLFLEPFIRASHEIDNGTDITYRIGGDVEYRLSSEKKAVVSIHTDFSQADVDDEVVQLDQYSIFLPEKRAFFVENADLFRVYDQNSGINVDVFSSRRIGLSSDGEPIPILAGGKYVDRTKHYDFGLMTMMTDQYGDISQTNYHILRYRRHLTKKSFGFLSTTSWSNDFNQTLSVDYDVRPYSWFKARGFMSRSFDDDSSREGMSIYSRAAVSFEKFYNLFTYCYVDKEYSPDIGYVREKNMHRFNNYSTYTQYAPFTFFPELHKTSMYALLRKKISLTGQFKEEIIAHGHTLTFTNFNELSVSTTYKKNKITESFSLYGNVIDAASYSTLSGKVSLKNNPAKKVNVSISTEYGGYYSGHIYKHNLETISQISDTFLLNFNVNNNKAILNSGGFHSTIYSISSEVVWANYWSNHVKIQYNQLSELLGGNIRFFYRPTTKDTAMVLIHYVNDYERHDQGLQLILKYTKTY